MELMNAKGTRDFPPEEKILRQEVVDTLREVFELYGFSPLETPIIERFETLSSKYAGGAEILKETFKFTDQGDRELGLRYDLTVPFCRFVGMNPTMKMPFKRYEIGRVFRDGPIKLGRYREFWQCDVDIMGTNSMIAESEIINLTKDIFKKLGFSITIKINNRKVLNGLLEYCGVSKEKTDDTILSIDKLEKVGEKGVIQELQAKGLNDDIIKKILKTFKLDKSNKETINEIKKLLPDNEGIKEVEELFSYIDDKDVKFDISLARGLSYYTGTVFEVFLKGSEIKNSAAAGGRYDKMIGAFLESKKEYPAMGISFGLEVIIDALKLAKKDLKKSVAQVYVIPIQTTKESIKICRQLREAGINTDMDLMGRGISKNLDYANVMGVPYVVFVGEEELKQKKFKLKDMKSGKEEMLSVEDIIKKL